MPEHPITVQLTRKVPPTMSDPRGLELMAEAEADNLPAALMAARTLVEDGDCLCHTITITLAPGYFFQDGVLQYSADQL